MILATLQSSAVLVVTLGFFLFLRRQSASVRHAILSIGLLSALAVPLVAPLLPELPHTRAIYSEVRNQAEIIWNSNLAVDPPQIETRSEPPRLRIEPLLWIWVAGMSVAGFVLIAGAVRVGVLLLRSTPVGPSDWLTLQKEVAGTLRLRRRVRLLHNERCVLGTWGVFRPKIFIPRDAGRWSEERIRVVLAHELAHVSRLDWPVQLLAEVARAVYWFNPLFWLVCRWLRSESEHACDDAVLQTGVDAKDYAAHLLDLARTLKNSNRPWAPVLAMSRPPHLERRFVAMLNSSLNRRSVTPAKLFAMIAVAVCVAMPLANMHASAEERLAVPLLSVVAPIVPILAPVEGAPTPVTAPVAGKKTASPKPAPVVEPQGLADGRLFGTLLDGNGAVIPGVTVSAYVYDPVQVATKNAAGEVQVTRGSGGAPAVTAVTNEVGRFDFPALVPGSYSIQAELPGFATYRGPRIEIKSSQSVYQNIFMSVGNISQRVVVSTTGQPRPPAPQVTPRRVRVGGNVIAANLISQVKPIYPESAREAGIEGMVHMQGIIGADGSFMTLRVVSSSDVDLAKAALEAVKQWRYKPTLLDGEPIEVQTEIEVEFKLSQ